MERHSFLTGLVLKLDAHHRLLIAGTLGLAAIAATPVALVMRILVGWNVFAATTLALCWLCILLAEPRTIVREARLQDGSRTAIFLFVIVASLASLLGVGLLLAQAKGWASGHAVTDGVLAGLTVASSWCLIHTIFALRYAHIFYQASDEPTPSTTRGSGRGLDFPSEKHPDFLDFAYFAFVVGMTCQVSDVPVTSRRLRRLVLLHGVLAFVFNTVILALSINLAASLFNSH